MTKLKKKDEGLVEMCHNCRYAQQPEEFLITMILCEKTDKVHKYDYSCKKWRIQE